MLGSNLLQSFSNSYAAVDRHDASMPDDPPEAMPHDALLLLLGNDLNEAGMSLKFQLFSTQ